jgi:hypothetical protein
MPDPQDVNHKRIPVSINDVLFANGESSIAFSIWDNKKYAVGIRWDSAQGGVGTGIGYPNSRGYPAWFILPDLAGIAILKGLLEATYAGKNKARIKRALQMLGAD